MSVPVKSQQEFYQLFVDTLQGLASDLTDLNEGSDIDVLAGSFSTAAQELTALIIDQFAKTFFETAHGPEVTEGPDDLQTLAVDHFGDTFARPQASAALDSAIFTRPNNSAGAINILAGTVVKTGLNADGVAQRYTTNAALLLTNSGAGTDLTGTVGITAVVPGSAGNASAGSINIIESTLLDKTIVVTNVGNSSGEDAEDDATYRETIRNLIQALAGATAAAVRAKALTVAGVKTATPIERMVAVKEYDIATDTVVGDYFRIPIPIVYIADASGMASPALIALVKAAIDQVRALGVHIEVLAGSPVMLSWTASITLNPSGPNYATFLTNTQKITESMKDYIVGLPVGTGFVRATANAAILAIWGPAGTNDLTAFTTSVPSGDVAAAAVQKMIPGTMAII
jgi:hypothetical protein